MILITRANEGEDSFSLSTDAAPGSARAVAALCVSVAAWHMNERSRDRQ